MRVFLKQYRFQIAISLSLFLHFFAFFVCPHLNKKQKATDTLQEISIVFASLNTAPVCTDIRDAFTQEETKLQLVSENVEQEKDLTIPTKKPLPKTITPIKPKAKPKETIKKNTKCSTVLKKETTTPLIACEEGKSRDGENAEVTKHGHSLSLEQQPQSVVPSTLPIMQAKFKQKPPIPEYPKSAYDRDIEGEVIVRILVDKDGNYKKIKVMNDHVHRLLIDAALRTITQKWKNLIEPHTQNGTYVDGWVEISIPFIIRR